MSRALIALGANIGDPRSNIDQAINKLRRIFEVEKLSSLYRTRPVGGPPDQPDFLNAVARIIPSASPSDTMNKLLEIEKEMGRIRKERWGPRVIDLDLLDQDGMIIEEPNLTLPHPRMHERAFVLEPLAEIDPSWRHPVNGLTARLLLDKLDEKDRAGILGREEIR